MAYFITTKEKRGTIQATNENKTILYNIDKVVKNVLAKNRGKNKKKRIVIYFSIFVYDIGLHCPNKRKKGESIFYYYFDNFKF